MPTYTVHAPPSPSGSPDPQRFVFVRDGFHFWAFLAGPFWFLAHRLWLALIGYLAAAIAVSLLSYVLVGSEGARVVIGFLFAMLVGLEAPTLRRWTYARNGWRNVGVVVGDDREDAERRFFQQWTPPVPSTASTPPAATPPRNPGHGIIGLFPEPGVKR
ncbi:MAG: hypothetical protein OJF62_001594 [Pseudolabrys sp.]|jgi:hypothetical protein|nr:hypothetical protein [Pseudolabrys sp.]